MQKQWQDLTRQDFIKLSSKMSGPEMAREFGVHHNAVYYRLRMFGIKADSKRRKFDPPKKELADLYARMSMAAIAEHYGVGETVVFMRLKEHGISGISRSDRLTGKPKSLAHRLAMSRSATLSGIRSGAKNGNWKGGVTSEHLRGRSRTAYHEWKASVLLRAQWKCETCGKEHGDICECCGHRILLHAHHRIHFSKDESKRYDVTNGRALCERCHWLEHHNKIG